MKSRYLKLFDVFLFFLIIILSALLFFSTQCSIINKRSPSYSEISFAAEENIDIKQNNKELSEKKTMKILTQNTMLIPFSFVAPAFNERTGCIINMILSDYEIVCLQEVFNGSSQDRIISSWNDMIKRNINDGRSEQWQDGYFNSWYYSLPVQDKDMWHSLNDAQSIEVLENNKNFWGVKILDRRVNDIEAKLICNPYYIMGPDRGHLNIRQDGGLIILSKYPIIECGAMTYSSSSGSDRLANKGVIYARVQVSPFKGDYLHIFNTHIQSHGYSETRMKQISELLDYISDIIESDKDYIRPVLIAGDFNVPAEKPDNWMELADIDPPEAGNTNRSAYVSEETGEYARFREIIEKFPSDHLNAMHSVYLIDSWHESKSQDPGFTWIGKDWVTGSKNSYGDIGNQVAIEDGGPERIDYIFYYKGTDNIHIEPISVSLVPDRPDLLYCFDKKPWEDENQSSYDCMEIYQVGDCVYKSYTVSDHLGIELGFEVNLY